jgi:hypothetical protein
MGSFRWNSRIKGTIESLSPKTMAPASRPSRTTSLRYSPRLGSLCTRPSLSHDPAGLPGGSFGSGY